MTIRSESIHALILSTVMLLAACSSGPPSYPVISPSPSAAPAAKTAATDTDACEHFEKGPALAVTATETATATSPLVSTPHSRIDITVPGTGNRQAFARFAVSKAGDYVMYLNKATTLTVLNDAKAPVTPEATATAAAGCATAKARHTYPLTIGTYYVQLGPTTESQISFVAIAGSDEGH
jgi:hypothetical protein